MRHVARILLLAAVVVVAGCSLFRDSDVRIAEVTSITAPDTVVIGTTFVVTAHAFFASDMSWVFDRAEVTCKDASLEVRVWSHRWEGGSAVPQVVSERDLSFQARPLELGEYRINAHQPDGSTTEKTIAVLP
ncbi:hypothetical protein JXD38_04630 [candidate division WOR-3 bacterium]|nr:hypothetical protein [candidate division WOR-3 bacterium]